MRILTCQLAFGVSSKLAAWVQICKVQIFDLGNIDLQRSNNVIISFHLIIKTLTGSSFRVAIFADTTSLSTICSSETIIAIECANIRTPMKLVYTRFCA